LWLVACLQCTQNRDKLYGIIPLLDWGNIVAPIPDYTKSDLEVALEFVIPMFDIFRRHAAAVDPCELCHSILVCLELNQRSEGILDAIEARRGIAEKNLAGLRLPIDAPSAKKMRNLAKGWRITSEHFIRREPSISVWKFPGNMKFEARLPHWVETGHWILQIDSAYYFSLLVLGELTDGFASPILGQGYAGPVYAKEPADSHFHIYWDKEDLLLCSIMEEGISETASQDQINTGVSRRENPGSSYAIRVSSV
jgi:hypothetical protein